MANHDFRCPDCGTVRRDINVPVSLGASHAEVYCRTCDEDLGRMIRCEPVPAARFSMFSDADSRSRSDDHTKADVLVEDPRGGFRRETVGSLADIRRLERESEQAERNGEGRKMIWRDYANGPSNSDQHTIMADPSLKPAKTFSNGTPVMRRSGEAVTATHGTVED